MESFLFATPVKTSLANEYKWKEEKPRGGGGLIPTLMSMDDRRFFRG